MNVWLFRFVWLYLNCIVGLFCMRWYVKNGRDGWDKIYLCVEDCFKFLGKLSKYGKYLFFM